MSAISLSTSPPGVTAMTASSVTIRSTTARPVIYGQTRVGGTIVFMHATSGNRELHLVDDVGFGRDDQRIAREGLRKLQDAAGRADIIGMVDDVRRAFGMRGHWNAGMLRFQFQQFSFRKRLMHNAHARPQQHVTVELTAQIATQMPVGSKNDFLFGRDLAQNRLGA